MAEGDAKAKRRGRKPSSAETRPRRTLAFRVRSELLEELERSAQKNGRSISEEVEANLEMNFAGRTLIEPYDNPLSLDVIDEMNKAIAEINEKNAFQNRLLNVFLSMVDVVKSASIKEIHDKAKSIAEFVDELGDINIAKKLFENEYFGHNIITENINRAVVELEDRQKNDS